MTRFFALAALLSALVSPVFSAPIRFVGSDLVAAPLEAEMKSFAAKNDLEISLNMRGSRLGLEDLGAQAGDLGLLVFAEGDTRPGPEFSSSVVGYMTAVFVVPQSVPLVQLHYAQLAGVYGASELNNFKRWSELGVSGNWAVRGITAVAASRREGLAIDLFRFGVLQKPEFKPTVAMFDDKSRALARISGEEGGIALVSSPPPEGSGLKVLLLAKGERDVAYGPTSENLHTGDYPLRLPVHLVFRKSEARRLSFVIRHLLADETTPMLLAAGVVPLPVQARNQLIFDLENLR
jgi:phosphate transport system substrate-binding protein